MQTENKVRGEVDETLEINIKMENGKL